MTYKLDWHPIQTRIDSGLIRISNHPSLPLQILTYSNKCEIERAWDKHTMMCRGLVVHTDTKEVICQTFSKFFNLDARENTKLVNLPKGKFSVTEKMDGSLIQVFYFNGKWHCTTKGSFANEYIDYALTQLPNMGMLPKHAVFACEVVLPDNLEGMRRVVAHEPGLYLLASFDRYRTYKELDFKTIADAWVNAGGKTTRVFEGHELADLAAELKKRDDTEGWVVRFENGLRVKFKTFWYLYCHRFVGELNEGSIKQMIISHLDFPEGDEIWINHFPVQMRDEARAIRQNILDRHRKEYDRLLEKFNEINHPERKVFASRAKDDPYSFALFAMYDRKDFSTRLLEVIS